jgi:ferredoxin-thioredoxin reductase catalytic chain
VRQRAEADAKTYGYHLHPDPEFLRNLLEGLVQNEERYGYPSCPCRLASGRFEYDRDIICPCDYRDPDVEEFGTCYCALYVRKDVFEGKTPVQPVPERRPSEKQAGAYGTPLETSNKPPEKITKTLEFQNPKLRLWYCKQCGYVVFREDPPYICPICKARKEIFSQIKIQSSIQG